jgi:hypothetical protein
MVVAQTRILKKATMAQTPKSLRRAFPQESGLPAIIVAVEYLYYF